ncbi:MAG: HaeIII family restriction endonuclease [Prevotella sp.]|nr:HaeIII family restriction endonuclease [Prevotella sp.]
MSDKSNNQGRAYEAACLNVLEAEIGRMRRVVVVRGRAFRIDEELFEELPEELKKTYKTSALAAVKKIFELEPCILEDGTDAVELSIQQDTRGEEGDVRDVLIVRRDIHWEIGLSLKHDHFAVKHSRLSNVLDFGGKWYNVPCSGKYRTSIAPIFAYLETEKSKHTMFRDLPDKERDVYVPLLTAFIEEIKFQYKTHKDIPGKLVEYLSGKYDFYKIISIDREKLTRVQAYNTHGTLNRRGRTRTATIYVPVAPLPTRIVSLDFAPGKSNTAELYMDNGWQFSFRIHNASTYVEASLKFDIQVIGVPAAIISINCIWGQ